MQVVWLLTTKRRVDELRASLSRVVDLRPRYFLVRSTGSTQLASNLITVTGGELQPGSNRAQTEPVPEFR
jgi:hypothetical protein